MKLNYKRLVETAKALQPSYKEQKQFHVTFILKKDRILSIGINNPYKTHTRNLDFPYTNADQKGTHSELASIIKLGEEDCSHYIFINIRVDKNRNVILSKPCSGCQGLLKQVGFKRMFYSINEETYEEWQ